MNKLYVVMIAIAITSLSQASAVIYLDSMQQRNKSGTISGSGVVSGGTVIKSSSSGSTSTETGLRVFATSTITTSSSGTQPSPSSTLVDPEIMSIPLVAPNTNPISQLPELERDAEFLMSLRWLYEQRLTKYQDPDQFMPENYLTRVDAAKMLSMLSKNVFNHTSTINTKCNYSDITSFDLVTQGQVNEACQLGIFKSAPLFNPNQGITQGQLITVLIRMFDGRTYDETTTPRYKNYIQRAFELGLLTSTSSAGMDEVISRLDVAKLLYKLRNIHLNKNPINASVKPFIHIINKQENQYAYQALIDVSMIRDDSLQTLEMKLDTVTYYFGKTKVYNYGATLNNYQVYGYLYASSDSITAIGVGTRRVQGGVIQEGNLVIRGEPQTIYRITPNREATIYMITKKE